MVIFVFEKNLELLRAEIMSSVSLSKYKSGPKLFVFVYKAPCLDHVFSNELDFHVFDNLRYTTNLYKKPTVRQNCFSSLIFSVVIILEDQIIPKAI